MKKDEYITITKESYQQMNHLLIERAKYIENLQEQLRIATNALKQYSWGDNWLSGDCRGQVFLPTKYGYSIADDALDEMEYVK